MHVPAVQIDGLRSAVEQLEEIILERRAGVATAAVHLAEHHAQVRRRIRSPADLGRVRALRAVDRGHDVVIRGSIRDGAVRESGRPRGRGRGVRAGRSAAPDVVRGRPADGIPDQVDLRVAYRLRESRWYRRWWPYSLRGFIRVAA